MLPPSYGYRGRGEHHRAGEGETGSAAKQGGAMEKLSRAPIKKCRQVARENTAVRFHANSTLLYVYSDRFPDGPGGGRKKRLPPALIP